MNHPTREEWMSYLYDELSAAERRNLDQHQQTCPECAAKVNDWQMARKGLDDWQFPGQPRRLVRDQPALKWAVAATIALCLGFGVGRFASATVEVEKVRAAMEPEMRQRCRQEFVQLLRAELDKSASATLFASARQTKALLADYANTAERTRAADNETFSAALNKLALQHDRDFVLLKKDLDIVAVNTDAGLRRTEQQVIQLADAAQPDGASDSTLK